MPSKRPPVTDADYRVVHGPWPRWVLRLSLFTLVGWGALVSALVIVAAILLLAVFNRFG